MPEIALPDSMNQVELDWYADDKLVRAVPRDQARFDIQKDRAIGILRRVKEADLWGRQFNFLLSRLADWLRSRQDRISSAILTLQENSLAFIVVRRQAKYDEQFQDDLAELDFAVANDPDLNLIDLKTLALPNVTGEAVRSFLDDRLLFSFPHHGE